VQARRSLCQRLYLPWYIIGKLDASHAPGQAWEEVTNKANVTIDLFAVNPVTAFYIKGLVNQYPVHFKLHTGTAVSLINSKTWNNVRGSEHVLTTGDNPALMGVGGHPIMV